MGDFNKNITVAVVTKNRRPVITRFVETLTDSLHYRDFGQRPFTYIFYNGPTKASEFEALPNFKFNEVEFPQEHGLTSIWNKALIFAPTDWVLLCNDDIEFKQGWLEYLEEKIAAGAHDLIHLFGYGCFLMHKKLLLSVGWFDERFRGGGYEDNDYQLRIMEAGLKSRVDISRDFIYRNGGREIGHFVDHTKYMHQDLSLPWKHDNEPWFNSKWYKESHHIYRRKRADVDWYPSHTVLLEELYGAKSSWYAAGKHSMKNNKAVSH